MTSDDQVNAALEREAEFDILELEVGASTAPYLRATTAERDRRVLAAEVRRLDAMRCETCRWCAKDWPCTLTDICAKVSIPGHSVAVVACSQLGGGCLAWEKRDEA